MKEIIYDVMVGAIILGVVAVAVLPLFFKNITFMNRSAQNKTELEQVGVTAEMQENAYYSAADIIALGKWYNGSQTVEVKKKAGGTVTITASNNGGLSLTGGARYKLTQITEELSGNPKKYHFEEQ